MVVNSACAFWRAPSCKRHTPSPMNDQTAALNFLLLRMQHKSDFPALSEAVMQVLALADSDDENLASLSSKILKDVGLTHKLLRLVNSSYHRHRWGGSISTVSRAVALVGLSGVRNLALSLIVLESMRSRPDINRVYEVFLRALTAATLASELCNDRRESEEAFISGMMQNLGHMLVQFYLPEEAHQIELLLEKRTARSEAVPPRPPGAAETDQVVESVLKVGYADLAVGVARHWGLPDALVYTLRPYSVLDEPPRPREPADRLRALASAANELTQALKDPVPERLEAHRQTLLQRYHASLGLSAETVASAVQTTRERMQELVNALQIPASAQTALQHWIAPPQAHESPLKSDLEGPHGMPHGGLHEAHAHALPAGAVDLGRQPQSAPVSTADILEAGITDISNTLVEDQLNLNEVVRTALETLYRGLRPQRVVFCLRDVKTGALTGRMALGLDAEIARQRFQVTIRPPLPNPPDLFSTVCLKGVDTLISDAHLPSLSARLPGWYTATLNAPAFLLLPLRLQGAPIGLFYADQAEAGGIQLSERELGQLSTLRNQVVMAFKQSR